LPKLFHSGDIIANPIYDNNVGYIVSQSGVTAAFNINTGEELWNIPVGGFETPSFSGESLFINGNMGLLVAVDTKTGNLRWKNQFPKYINVDSYFAEKELALYKGPTLVNSHILFSNHNGRIMIIDANTGEEKDSIKVGRLATSPMPAEKKVLFLTVNGKLIAYE
jgi:outer membrane protein assembly factor BamB